MRKNDLHSSSAFVCLHVDNILKSCPVPALLLRLPFVRYVVFADVLYHEIGHHIHKTCRPVFDGKENSRKIGAANSAATFFARNTRISALSPSP